MRSDVTQLPLHDRLWAWFEEHKAQVAVGAVVALALGVLVGYIVWRQGEKQVQAAEALSRVATPRFGGNERIESDALLKVAEDHSGTSAAARAVLLAAGNLFAEGKYPEAQKQFERYLREFRQTPFVGQAKLGVAASLDAQGKTDEAIAAYRDLVDRHPGDNTVPQAKFALARLHETKGNLEQARNLFEELARADASGSLGSEAGIRYEELIARHPELAPPPPAPPTPAPEPNITITPEPSAP